MTLRKKLSDFDLRDKDDLSSLAYLVGYEDTDEIRITIGELMVYIEDVISSAVDLTTEINALDPKASPVIADGLVITDSADSFTAKQTTVEKIRDLAYTYTKAVADLTYLPIFANVVEVTSDITISNVNQATYMGAIIRVNSTGNRQVTFGTGLTAGFQCVIVRQNTGEVEVVESGTTVNSEDSKKRINIRYGAVSAVCYASNTLFLFGNLKT